MHPIKHGLICWFVIAEVLPLSEVRRAHELSEAGHTRGKIILEP